MEDSQRASNKPKIIRTQMKAIRAKCIECCCGDTKEVDLCTAEDCPLYHYRFGKTPKGFTKVNKLNLQKRRTNANSTRTTRQNRRARSTGTH